MKTATAALISLLADNREYRMSELLTITTVGGEILRYSSGDQRVTWGGNDYLITGPIFKRGAIRTVRGLAVDTMDLTIQTTDPTHLLNGMPFIKAAASGALDGATVKVERAFFSAWDAPVVGTLVLFLGRVSSLGDISRYSVEVNVASDLELLNVRVPRNVYTPNCSLNVYSSPCGVNKASFTVTGTVEDVLASRVKFDSGLTQAAEYFDLGVLTFTSGANAGLSRTVKNYAAGGIFEFALPWTFNLAVGDTFSVYPGCDKTKATCTSRFSNVIRFRGFPYIPAPETIT